MSLLAFIALLVSSALMVPDVHAEQGESFAHAGDHIYAHGAEHFGSGEPDSDTEDQDPPTAHHHNCSVNLALCGTPPETVLWYSDSLKGPLASSPLASRAPPVLIQPPKA